MSAGRSFDIAKLGKLPENFFVRNQIPQETVLKQANLFLTHGGDPLSVRPTGECLAGGELGLGKVLNYKGVIADILKETAMAVMEDTQIRENLRNTDFR